MQVMLNAAYEVKVSLLLIFDGKNHLRYSTELLGKMSLQYDIDILRVEPILRGDRSIINIYTQVK